MDDDYNPVPRRRVQDPARLIRVKDHERLLAEAVQAERQRCLELVKRFITFDNYQQHTHSWHCLQDCLDAIRKGEA